jgi:2,4-dienoyl-CoA reductase-like NADH-dependent reductase (Old Yellow Enzyme family)
VGLIVLEEAQVHPSSHPYARAVRGDDPAIVGAYRRLAASLHDAGTLVLAQLSHVGMQGTGQILKQALWAPSAVPNPATLEMPKVMEPEDITAIVQGFALAARHAMEGGLDGVEVNAGQHSLVRQFLSGLTNQRQDEYGGDPERRLRFAREVLAAVREAVGEEGLVGLRLCCDERAPWAGITPEQAPELAAALAPGVDYVAVTVGSIYSVEATRAGPHEPPGYLLDLAGAVRARLAGVPVFASGSLVDPEQAATAVARGLADACEMTRALIADPDLPRKLEEGRAGQVRPCIRCNQDCVVRSTNNVPVGCIHNPEAGREREFPPLVRAGRGRRVVVVGGGPAGMEVARVAALRGHRVTLLERATMLGGTPRAVAAAGQRPPLGLVSGWLADRLAELEVEVKLGTSADRALITSLSPDLVVLATGARPRSPDRLPGGSLPHVLTVRDVLAGRLPGKGPVLVIDRTGSYPAIDVARYAAERKRPVTIVSEDPFISAQLGPIGELAPWYRIAAAWGIELRPLTVVCEIRPESVRLRQRFGPKEEELETDCVVVADHELPDDALYHEFVGTLPAAEVRRVGDCVAPRRVLHALIEGGRVGREA